MVEMVEDMDNLDDKLFSTFKKNPSTEKKITFADEDDMLDDLLADKNFSSGQKNPIRDKSIIDDLFNKKVSNESLSNEKENLTSVLSTTGIDKSKMTSDKARKMSLMQDLFGDTLHMSPSKESNASKKSVQIEQGITQHATESKIQSQHSTYAPTAGTREPRRGKRTSEIINDPLGLFTLSTMSNQTEKTEERCTVSADSSRQKPETKQNLPDWLEPKKITEDKNSDYVQDKIMPTEELFSRHRRNSSDKIVQEDETRVAELLPHEKKKTKLLDNQKLEMNEYEKQNEENYHKLNVVDVPLDANKNSENPYSNLTRKDASYDNMIYKLELEKSHLTVAIHSLNEKYENEIMILDESYKRQIGFLQERTDTLEKRMQQELECLETDYEAKIEKLKNEKMQIETFYKEEIQNLKKEHAQFIEEIYKRHSENTRLLQKEHFDTIESILKMREVENLAMTTITTHKTDMQNLLQKADFIIENIKNVQEKTDHREDQSIKLREYYLKSQEEDMQIRNVEIKKQQELQMEERDKMMKVADKLDLHVAQLMLELEKKSTMLTEALETLKKREQSLSHERELFEEKVQWEYNHLQTLKESWLNEQEKELKILTKEKEAIAAKKMQYEVLKTIKTNSDNITKIESAVAIKTAQDATIFANQERLKWQEKMKYLEAQEQALQEKEFQLLARAKDIENFTQVAFAKNEEAIKALKEARNIENESKTKFDSNFNDVFRKLNSTSEKMALTTTQLEKSKKNIPYSANRRTLSNPQHAFQFTTHFTEVVDPQLVMLKLNLDDQLNDIQYI
ncbi:LOW QUALITY PROTEIN: trichohyalin-like [Nylanderia fulva]|uniref:LOW QUALITY PROTEIN: trichohyalin-like n=1 Tax=Nylanderia fulva TaxID=613905 RepID=UPI0010FB980B|nr:LOW QUALITY PROTEIN: trichohyalin-like [Nylanderia fulva]